VLHFVNRINKKLSRTESQGPGQEFKFSP